MAMMIGMPKLGLTMTEGLVAKWYKKEGDAVKTGDILFEVETDKLTNEVEAPCDGVLLKIVSDTGATVPCKAPVAYIGELGEAVPDAEAAQAQAPSTFEKESALSSAPASAPMPTAGATAYALATPAAKARAKERGIAIGSIQGTGPNGSIVLKDVEAQSASGGVKASPLASKIAHDLGIDIQGLDAGKRVMSEDVLRAGMKAEQTAGTREPLSNMRKTIARRMSESWTTSPRVCFEMQVDCTAMQDLRQSLKAHLTAKGIKLTYNHIIMRAVAQALCEHPVINASLEGDALLIHDAVNLGIAVGVENGLLVPNLKDCGRMGLEAIADGTEDMISRARTGKLTMDELSGGTFTITNLGMYGMRAFSPIINQPELAILGVNAIVDTPVAVHGAVEIRPMMNLNLVADHRVIDGVRAAIFLQRIVELLENPAMMLL